MSELNPPFRWDLTQRSQLGRLIEGEMAPTFDGFEEELLEACAKVIGFAGESELVFVGRSPESIFDHLSGLLSDTSLFERLVLLRFSMQNDETAIREEHKGAIESMREYLHGLGLDPEGIATAPRKIAFIDLVYTGGTFGRLVTFFHNWSSDEGFDWNAVKRRIRLIGITVRKKTSPNTWRWHQNADWLEILGKSAVKNVSISYWLWDYFGNNQDKTTRSYAPPWWGSEELASPDHHEAHLRALRLAFELFESGRSKKKREEFAGLLAKQPAMKQAWFRSLINEIRGR